ncbi:MAG: hypothetical protein KF700_10590 [Hyphomonadaceae bacterium]|nr:hypothetical protein [Hyphomonadaceae bacterium]
MAVEQASWMLQGGGAQALVFAGCAQEGCAAGRGIVAIDPSTGSAFVGVRDAAGSTQLRAEPRVETLLELMSPARSWENAQPPPAPAAP